MTTFKTIFIVNPAASQGRLQGAWYDFQKKLRGRIKNFSFRYTRHPRHATELTRHALKDGYQMVVAVGGDGTINECVNGFFNGKKPVNPKAVLGILPYGRGCDFARGMKIPRDPFAAIKRLVNKKVMSVDVGKISCSDLRGRKSIHHFINIANVGIVPHVVNWGQRSPKFLGAQISYIYGSICGAFEYRPSEVMYSSNLGTKRKIIFNIVIANGRYFGSNMKIAPYAKPNDGFFDVLVIKKIKTMKFLLNFSKLYSGKHVRFPEIDTFKCKKINVSPIKNVGAYCDTPLLVEADGDTIGKIPATFEVLPKAIRLKI